MAAKKGDVERTSSWAANSRCSGPTQRVTIAEVRVLDGVSIVGLILRGVTYLPAGGLSGFLDFSTFLAVAA